MINEFGIQGKKPNSFPTNGSCNSQDSTHVNNAPSKTFKNMLLGQRH
jgi:hypothetical protein